MYKVNWAGVVIWVVVILAVAAVWISLGGYEIQAQGVVLYTDSQGTTYHSYDSPELQTNRAWNPPTRSVSYTSRTPNHRVTSTSRYTWEGWPPSRPINEELVICYINDAGTICSNRAGRVFTSF